MKPVRVATRRAFIRVGCDILGNLVDGTKVQTELFDGVSLGHASGKEATNLGPKLHILQHSLQELFHIDTGS